MEEKGGRGEGGRCSSTFMVGFTSVKLNHHMTVGTLFAWGDVHVAAQLKFVDESDSVKRSD